MDAARAEIEHANPDGFSRAQKKGIEVAASQAEFLDLERRLNSPHWSHNTATSSHTSISDDLENHTSSNSTIPQPFNLEETLRGTQLAAERSGIRPKHIGVMWEDLSVYGINCSNNYVKTFLDAIISIINPLKIARGLICFKKDVKDRKILNSFRGLVKPGEMVLVLGRPGSGCSTFLKVITNQREGYSQVNGDVLYGSFDDKTFAAKYRGETVYNQEDDIHLPTLTVGQTLGFAMDLKTPGKLPIGVSKAKFKEEVITTLLKMFNIEHVRDSIIGDQFLRGISGGEKKRVSIAEMLITSATVCAWDNSTRGLDASSALDFVKSLRIMTNIYQTTTFVSLYQASESIYRHFDKVLVIDSGQEVFFGPIQEARNYFEQLGFKNKPRMQTPDFLTSCTDEFEREYTESYMAENIPHTPDMLRTAFNQSRNAQDLENEMNQYRRRLMEDEKINNDFEIAVRDSKMRRTSKNSVYTAPFYLQVWTLFRRCFLVKWQDRFSFVITWITSTVTALVIGSVWLNVPSTSAGAFTRGGLLYFGLVFPVLEAFSELVSTIMGRSLLNKHKAFTFYRPSALLIAQLLVDLIFNAAKILSFCIIIYFMCGLVRDAGSFFIFYSIILLAYLYMSLFFRILGLVSPDFDYGFILSVIFVSLFIMTTGYLIQNQFQRPYFAWIYYVNALALAFTTLMINEFSKLSLMCTSESLIPSGSRYKNIVNQVCTLPGSISGTLEVSGSNYIKEAFSYDPEKLWRNFGIVILLIIFLTIAYIILGERISWNTSGNSIKVFLKPNKEREGLNMALMRKLEKRSSTPRVELSDENVKIESQTILTWEDLCYDVPTPSGKLRLLKDIYGYVRPGSLTALMGVSGAGKTTLLDVLAARKNIGVVTGTILVDGLLPKTSFQRVISYAEQQDMCEPTQTVREALRFSADLRQPYNTPQAEKYEYVEEIISLLEMNDIADAIIGQPETGLSLEERKRVTIGVELAAKPTMLFLDEPTSGLDSQSAFNIVRFLRKLMRAGQAIICTIHQPNSTLFENFDRLLLLQRGGQTVYFGDIGSDAIVLRSYFEKYGAVCPPNANVAEWLLEAIDPARIGNQNWAENWSKSSDLVNLKESITIMKNQRLQELKNSMNVREKEFATPLYHQLKIVIFRTCLSFWRTPNYGFTRLFNHIIIALVFGLTYFNLDDSLTSLQYRTFVIFQVTVLPYLILYQVEVKYGISRMIYFREASAKMYHQFVFASSLVVAEIPYSLLCALGFFLPFYFLPGLSTIPSRAGYQFIMILVIEFFTVTLGQLIAALTPSPFISSLVNPFFLVAFALFCGVAIPKSSLPKYWRWLHELDPITRLVGGMVVTELHDLPVNCKSSELKSFTAPINETCGEYMKDYFKDNWPGYLVDNYTQTCQYCRYKVGDQFYTGLGLNFNNRWRDLGILLSMTVSNLILLFIAGLSRLMFSYSHFSLDENQSVRSQ